MSDPVIEKSAKRLHVIPLGDLDGHEGSMECWCSPLANDALFGCPATECAVKSNQGQHCDRPPTRIVSINSEQLALCDQCCDNACAGAYGDVAVIPIREIRLPNAGQHPTAEAP